jgi:probable rRNA maturation factor
MPTWRVNVQIDGRYAGKVRAALLRRAARAALRHQAAGPGVELSIALTGDATLHRLNRQFLGIDAPTDVLAFPSQAPASQLPTTNHESRNPGRPAYLGDIAISFRRATVQARSAGHPVEAELQLLAVHGVLHLLGHDHARRRDQARMWAAQEEILRELREGKERKARRR